MKSTYRARVFTGFAACLMLGLTAGCATTSVEPSASPRTDEGPAISLDQEQCIHEGGVWHSVIGVCEFNTSE